MNMNRELKIAYGSSCFAKVWSNKTITFDALKIQHDAGAERDDSRSGTGWQRTTMANTRGRGSANAKEEG